MARRKTTTSSKKGDTTTISNNAAEAGIQPTHRTADQPKGVLRSSTTTTTTQPNPVQTTDPRRAIQMMPKEFEALIGLRRMQLGLDAYSSRQRELARLEVEDPVGHYYAQSPAERAPYQLQAAAALFEMGGGGVSGPVAALTLMKLRREEGKRAKRRVMATLLGAWRAAKAKKEEGEGAEKVEEETGKTRRRKGRLSAEEGAGGEPPKKKRSVRFGGEE